MRWQAKVLGTLGAVAVVVAVAAVVWLPQQVYPPLTSRDLSGVASKEKRVELEQAQSRVQNDLRGQLLQTLGGLVVVAGAAVGWQQFRLAREGQITERFTRAIDHLGSETLDVRLGGIYALERVAKNSPDDQPTVTDILCAFVREHARWPVGAPDGPEHPTRTVDSHMPWLTSRAPDVQTALYVLGRRAGHPQEHALYLSRADLRRAQLSKAQLAGANLRHSNLSRAYMPDSNLERSQLVNADLRHAHLQRARLFQANLRGAHLHHADLRQADLRGAHLHHADLRQADLRGADLRGANLSGAHLEGADLTDARIDDTTTWPDTHGRP
ncbi:pentapeptide repeat-containing protein [Streptomyces sp. NPDC001652]|uniref:pentapeptide repeat-containing protein n=1 Tax=Streptomyces sp. NPDC001652 TaxID=3154393 RepID=UPI00332DF323